MTEQEENWSTIIALIASGILLIALVVSISIYFTNRPKNSTPQSHCHCGCKYKLNQELK